MLRFLPKLALSSVVACGLAAAQITAEPPASAVVSSANDNSNGPDAGNAAIEPGQPPSASVIADPVSLLPDLPPVPVANATLVGGTIEKLDRVRDQITLSVFGGGREKILFDPRTRIYQGTTEVTAANLREGQRVYLDTILDGTTVFARSIRLKTTAALGESQGVVLKYRPDRGELMIRDSISPAAVRVRVNSSTRLLQGDRAVPASQLAEGCLITVKFASEGNGHDLAREISILAMPGVHYTFQGQIVHLDLRTGLLVLNSSTDHKTYEIYLDPATAPDENLHTGAVVTVITNFEKSRYVARNVTIESSGK